MKLLSIMNANEGRKKKLRGLQKSGGQEENKVLLGKKSKSYEFLHTKRCGEIIVILLSQPDPFHQTTDEVLK